MSSKRVVSVLMFLLTPRLIFPQNAGETALKQEKLWETKMDYEVILANIATAEKAYTTINTSFCNVRLPQPALGMRTMYCNPKRAELNARDADLRSQAQKLKLDIDQLTVQIQEAKP